MVKFSVVQLTDDDKDLWNEFVTDNSYAHVYHLWEWGEVLCKTYNYQRYYLAVKCGEDIAGILPLLLIRSSIFADKLVSLPFCEYGGPLLEKFSDPSRARQTITMLIKVLTSLTRKSKIDYIELRHPPAPLASILASSGFKALRRYVTFKIDLTEGESELWRNLKKDARNPVRRAIKAGITIRNVKVDQVKQYYDLYLNAQKRHGSPPHSYNFFMNVYDSFKPKGLLQMLFAIYDGEPIGGIMVFCFDGKTYDWSAVTDPKYRNLSPNNFLLWHIIKWGKEKNFRVLDIGRTRPEARGMYHFKRGWGGLEVSLEDYLFLVRHVEIPDPTQGKYVYLSKMWSLLPVALAQRIGPKVINGIGL